MGQGEEGVHEHHCSIRKCENTKGCKFEKDLAEFLRTGEEHDKILVGFEQKFMRGERFTSK